MKDLWLVTIDGVPMVAYPRKLQAEVYVSGAARPEAFKIVPVRYEDSPSAADGLPKEGK